MISQRHADILKKVQRHQDLETRNKAIAHMNQAARGHHIYEHNFEDIDIDDVTYSGIMHVIYDAECSSGSLSTPEYIGSPPGCNATLLNTIIIPGDITPEDGEPIYDMETTLRLGREVGEVINADMLTQDIEEYHLKKISEYEPPDRDGEDR